MKIDPYKHKERWENWKEKTKNSILEISKVNSKIIKQYLSDMEKGLNIGARSVKGPRAPNRLNSIKDRMIFFCKKFKELYNVNNITEITEDQLFSFFSDMKNGIIKTGKGQQYHCIDTFGKIFKAFWHWHQKVNRKNGNEILDITIDLDSSQEKPNWVYLNEEQIKTLINAAKFEYKVLIIFLLDTGIRSPSELINIKVSDIYNGYKELNVRNEIVKRGSFGRRIKLMICSDLLKDYIKTKNLNPEDYLFKIVPKNANKYLKRLTIRLFGDNISEAGAKYSEISLYDFRHIACCYWLPRYKSESALKYRFGWKKSDKIHYYSELLGMKDTITQEDLVVDTTKTEMQKQISRLESENEILRNEVKTMKEQMDLTLKKVNILLNKTDLKAI